MVEHHLDMVVVGGSIPLAPTIFSITYVRLLDVEFICRAKKPGAIPGFSFCGAGLECCVHVLESDDRCQCVGSLRTVRQTP